MNNSSSGNSSRRPASMSKIRTSLEKSENMEKFPLGPTRERPGPMLLSVAATAEKLVIRSKLFSAISNMEKAKIKM